MVSTQTPLSLPHGFSYFWHDDIDSTNLEAWRKNAQDEVVDDQLSGSWFCAKTQSLGRGTKGNKWVSNSGNLYSSLLTRSACRSENLAQISILAALAAVTAIEQFASDQIHLDDLCLKWPNDILFNGAKMCGILVESRPSAQAGLTDIVIGTGINLASNPDVEGLFGAGNLTQHGWACSRDDLFVALVRSTRDWLAIWHDGKGFETLRLAWLERSCHIGHQVTIRVGEADFTGRFATISNEGALVLENADGLSKKFLSGHIVNIEGPRSKSENKHE